MQNTKSGLHYENKIKCSLERSNKNYRMRTRFDIGKKRNGGQHKIDILLNEKELISIKYQKTGGTAEEKIPYEVMKLQWAIEDYPQFTDATIILGGNDDAWTLKDYYLSDEFMEYMNCPNVRLMSEKDFLMEYIGKNDAEKDVNNKTDQESLGKFFQ